MVDKKISAYDKSVSKARKPVYGKARTPKVVIDAAPAKEVTPRVTIQLASDLALNWNPTIRRHKGLSQAQERTGFLIETIGTAAAVARILNVSRSQPLRWSKGEETPGPEAARLIIDLDHVLARATLVWQPEVAIDWVEGANSYLEGARPIDVLNERGPDEVLRALDAALV